MKLEELRVYALSMELGDEVWIAVSNWQYLAKDSLGKQWIRAADSIAANISEGYGRFHFKENRQFLFYARGSLYETETWFIKARSRQLLQPETEQKLEKIILDLTPQLHNYIRSIGKNYD